MALRLESPFGRGMKRASSSPPSPVFERAADAVHGNGERLVRFRADRAERHGAGGKTLYDFAGRLHFVKRKRTRDVFNSIKPRRVQRCLFCSSIKRA